jgi:nucleoside-diphosphate-sugar epimerase|tara:strand:+ start:890 stop:1828 length:939 start_codon:yes stop_codon:yes gene_type:complete
MKILITGGAGYIGSVLCKYLLENNHKVTVIDNFTFSYNSLLTYMGNKNFEVQKLDVRNYTEVNRIIKNFDLIIPLAALVGAPLCKLKEKEATEVNLESIKNIVDNISQNQAIIYPTTNSGYGIGEKDKYCTEETPLNPISLYGQTKTNAEKYISEKHENSIRYRLATVFGCSPRMRLDLLVNDFVFKAVKDGYVVLFEANFKRNYIHIRDICEAIIFSIKNFDNLKNETYNLGLSTANLSKLELCRKIKEYIPRFEISVNEIGSDIDKRDYIISNEKIEKKGFTAKISLDEGIIELKKFYNYVIPDNTMRNI